MWETTKYLKKIFGWKEEKLIWTNAQIQTTITTPETNAYGVESSRKSQNDSSNAEKEFNW